MENSILPGQTLKEIELNIEKEISTYEYWGDLELTFTELDILKEQLKNMLATEGATISRVCKMYPHAVTTYMVFFVRYKYDVNYWGALEKDLDIIIPINLHTELGQCAKGMFSKYNMDYSETKDEPHKNIAPIIFEAGLPPESALDDLFYVLSNDYYKVFDPQLIIDELIEMRSYTIRKPMYRFLSRFRDTRAVDYVLEVRDAMISAEQKHSRASRFAGNYLEWKEQEKSKTAISNRKKQEHQTRPYLFFDNGNKGLCIVLPRIILDSEWIEEVSWCIKDRNGLEKKIYCNVTGDDGKRYTNVLTVAVPPSDKYIIQLEDTEGLYDTSLNEWEIEGIKDDEIMYFNNSGRQVKANYLLYPYGVMIIPQNIEIVRADELDIIDQYYPTNSDYYRIISVTPLTNEAVLLFNVNGKTNSFTTRPQIIMELEGNTLFSLDATTGIFTEIPSLRVNVNGSVSQREFELRVGSESYPILIRQGEINVYDLNEFSAFWDKQFGIYSVRLYQMNRFIKQVEFSYVPVIETNYSNLINWPDSRWRKEKRVYKFKKPEDWEMEFENCAVSRNDNKYFVTVSPEFGSIITSLKSEKEDFQFNCSFELPMRPLNAEIIDDNGNIIENVTDKAYKTGIDSWIENEKWLSVRTNGIFREGFRYEIRLKTANGIEQTEKIGLAQNGAGNINLSVFQDTLLNCPLPAELEIICNGDEKKTMAILFVAENSELRKAVRYQIGKNKSYIVLDIADDGKDIDITRFGFAPKTIHLLYADSKLGASGKTRGYQYPDVLKEGIYSVSSNNRETFFEYESDKNIRLDIGTNILLVSGRDRTIEPKTSKQWLDMLVFDLVTSSRTDIKETQSYKILAKPDKIKALEAVMFDDCDIEKLVALAYFTNTKLTNTRKSFIRQCMRVISADYLHRGDRYRIIELLMELNVPQEVFDVAIKEYALLLFSYDGNEKKQLASKVEQYSIELSMMLMMSMNEPLRDCIVREKYRDFIGKDAISMLLSVPDAEDPEAVKAEQRKFLRETIGSKVSINLDDRIAGNEDAIQGMIRFEKNNPYFDITKKPDYGIYFGGIKYVDQYVNWFKSSHDKNMEMAHEKYKLMIRVVKENYDNIIRSISFLKSDAELGEMTKQYQEVIEKRYHMSSVIPLNTPCYPRYFFLQGLAAFLTRLPSERTDLDPIRNIGIRFMTDAYVVAPRLAQRDILMAETYRYLKRKEELLCQ